MKFYSTRDKNTAVSYKEAIFRGLAPDGGLYMPELTPDMSKLIGSFTAETPFNDIAAAVTHAMLSEELDADACERICSRAFDFIPKLVPVDDNISVLELYHGPSCAFKDFGASFLASSMEELLKSESLHSEAHKGEARRATILTATSGDTGSAVARAFYEKENIDVVILYPSGRVSPLQEKQLTTLGKNIRALEVKGSFDDCQRMVKEAFLDRELSERLNLTSANSISLGWLIPQSFYYIWAWAQLSGGRTTGTAGAAGRGNLWFCVPSGNFGNLTAGILAHSWGMGNRGFIAATNINDVVPEYLKSGDFNPRASQLTLSNAMDVGNPSNFERMLEIFEQSHEKMSDLIKEEVITDAETKQTIRALLSEKGYESDPHTAVGYLAAKRFLADAASGKIAAGANPQIISLSTAHPGKFTEVFEEATGKAPALPQRLPWNPGGHGGGALWGWPGGQGAAMSSDFHIWTFVHDVSGVDSVRFCYRIDADGAIPADNPFAGDPPADPADWSYGHRNIQGLVFDPLRNTVWASEHGARGGDELNRLTAGGNFGWPAATYSREYLGGLRISEHTSIPGMVDPLVVWMKAIAPSGLAVYTGERFPRWRGDLFVGGLQSEDVRRIDLDADGRVLGQTSLPIGQRVRDVRQGPDGLLYVLTDETDGRLIRLEPSGDSE